MANENIPELGLWQRLIGIITKPQETLAALAEKPTILGPAVVYCVVNLIFFLLTAPKLKSFSLINLEKMSKQMTPEQLAQAKSMVSVWAVVGGSVSIIVMPFVSWLVVSLLVKFFNMFVGDEAKFKQLYAVSVITSFPMLLGAALRSIIVMGSPAENFATVTTSAALALPKGSTGPLFAVLTLVDPFYIWSFVLLAMGSALVMKTSVKKTGIFVAVLWALYATGIAGIALISPAVTGV